ncbi:MAG: hypothetical protein ACM3QS_10980 [Bacteroidota bacterium]
MKRFLHILRPAALIGIGLVLATLSAAIGQPVITATSLSTVTPAQATPTPVPRSEVGSTDGLVLLSIIIVVIIIVPALIRRKTWNN